MHIDHVKVSSFRVVNRPRRNALPNLAWPRCEKPASRRRLPPGGWPSALRRAILVHAVIMAGIARADNIPPARITFNEHIRPILSENCYPCHGPDSNHREAKLRLDRAEFATAARGDHPPAIVPGKPGESELVWRITSKDEDERMPPIDSHKELTPGQIDLLQRWVREGAVYQEHWAFVAPKRPVVPSSARPPRGPVNAIDAFITDRLQIEGLSLSPEADRAALIRRVTYDLTGLPPTPAEVNAFVRDASGNAYENVVDRLLASPRYGEHRAHYWLDAARYADTHGLHRDNYRSIWPYRDYVINAYNLNKPFDQFAREQIAGDLLPADHLDQLVATGFIRAGISSAEGGTLIEELRVNNQRERAEMFGSVFLGLTVGCAACHDHKFDPVTQKDFYQLTAFFNNLAENPSNENREDWPPFIRIPPTANRSRFDQTLAARAAVQRKIDERRTHARELIETWLGQPGQKPAPVSPAELMVRLRFDEGRGATFANVAPPAAGQNVTATEGPPIWGEETWLWPSMRMDTSTRLELPEAGDVEANQPFSVGTWLMPRLETSASQSANFGSILARADSTKSGRGWELYFDQGKISFRLAHAWPERAIGIETEDPVLERGRWNHVLATYDGTGKAEGVKLFVDGRRRPCRVVQDSLSGTTRTSAPLAFGRQYPDASPLRQSRYLDFRFYARALTEAEAARVPREDYVAEIVQRAFSSWNDDELKVVSDFYFSERDRSMQALAAQLPVLEAELARLAADGDVTLVCAESPRLAYADVLKRGVYSARLERVRPGVPHFLPPLPVDQPLDRHGLADWTMSAANPLTARVTVNRMWQELFSTGLVETSEDFGVAGQPPSHADLLDWLAIDFRESGWNVKRFYRQLVMSAAYRQSSRATPRLLEKDPKNRLLARGPRFRMDGEMLRDTVLATSGLLVERIGGPSVKPYQPPGIWEAGGFSSPAKPAAVYIQDHGEALYRRSLYTFWKRMATMPNMDIFDAPVRDATCPRRQRTNTPLQALVAMNDPLWLEAARHLAGRVLQQGRDAQARLDFIGRLVLGRPWHERERVLLNQALEKIQAEYQHDAAAADELVKIGESPLDARTQSTELAIWMVVASAALNLDAVLNK